MNTAPAVSLTQLRAKTDRELAILVRRELNRGLTFANEARCRDAERSLAIAKTLLALTEISNNVRASLEQEMDQIRQALPCAMSAA
jgi:adenylylsulfate kinase-like enzyme